MAYSNYQKVRKVNKWPLVTLRRSGSGAEEDSENAEGLRKLRKKILKMRKASESCGTGFWKCGRPQKQILIMQSLLIVHDLHISTHVIPNLSQTQPYLLQALLPLPTLPTLRSALLPTLPKLRSNPTWPALNIQKPVHSNLSSFSEPPKTSSALP